MPMHAAFVPAILYSSINLLREAVGGQRAEDQRQEQREHAYQQTASQFRMAREKAEHEQQMLIASSLLTQRNARETLRIQFENQVELARLQALQALEREEELKKLQYFPLVGFVPRQLCESPQSLAVITRHPAGKVEIPAGGGTLDFGSLSSDLDAELGVFLQNGYGWGEHAHSTYFYQGVWRAQQLESSAAALSLRSYLKYRPTLFTQYRVVGDKIHFDVAHWGLNAERHSYFTFVIFPLTTAAEVRARLAALQCLAVCAVADMHAFYRDLSAPLLFKRLDEVVGGREDEVLRRAALIVIDAYVEALGGLSAVAPKELARILEAMHEQLSSADDQQYVKHFLVGSRGLRAEIRGLLAKPGRP